MAKTQEILSGRARARLQRLTDAKIYSGWTVEFTNELIRIRMLQDEPVQPGESYIIQVHAPENTLIFRVTATYTQGDESTFLIRSPIQKAPISENPRLAVDNMTGTLRTDHLTAFFEVLDVSTNGLGILAQASLPRHAKADILIHTKTGQLTAAGEV